MRYNGVKKKKMILHEGEERLSLVLINSLFGVGIACATAFLLCLGVSFCAYLCADPVAVVPVFAFFAVYVAAFVGGYASAKKNGGTGAICGAVCGVVLVFLSLILSLFFKESYSSGYGAFLTLALRCLAVLVSVLGGLFGDRRKTKRKRMHR